MPADRNEVSIQFFDPGGVTGYAWLIIDRKAFTNRRYFLLDHIKEIYSGEFGGTEKEVITQCIDLMREGRYGEMPFRADLRPGSVNKFAGSEDFELTQLVGGKNLLIPVRINAVLAWEAERLFNAELILQKRSERTQITRERLKRWKFPRITGKDAFAAMQHCVAYARKLKQQADMKPWRL